MIESAGGSDGLLEFLTPGVEGDVGLGLQGFPFTGGFMEPGA